MLDADDDPPTLVRTIDGKFWTANTNANAWWELRTFAELAHHFGTWKKMKEILKTKKWFVQKFVENRVKMDWKNKSLKKKSKKEKRSMPTITKDSTHFDTYRQFRFFQKLLLE